MSTISGRVEDRRGTTVTRGTIGLRALRSPGIRWIKEHMFGVGFRNHACEALAISYRWDRVPQASALAEITEWSVAHLPGYTVSEVKAVVETNYRRATPHRLSSRRLLALRDKDGQTMGSLAAAASCAATGGPELRHRKALAERVNRPLIEELASALEAIRAGRLAGTVSDADAAVICDIKPFQFKKHVKPLLARLGVVAVFRGRTAYTLTPPTYRRLSHLGLVAGLAAASSTSASCLFAQMWSLYPRLLRRVSELIDALRSRLRLIMMGQSAYRRSLAYGAQAFPEAIQDSAERSPPHRAEAS